MDLNKLISIAGQIVDNPTIAANATISFRRVLPYANQLNNDPSGENYENTYDAGTANKDVIDEIYDGGDATLSADVMQDAAGRYIPVPVSTEIVTLECYLRQTRVRDKEILQRGIDIDATYFVGRLVNPKTYNFPLSSNTPITVTINGRKGTMLLDEKTLASPSDQQYNIKSSLGQRIAFFVQFKQGS